MPKVTLTPAFVRQIKATTKTEFFDDQLTGFLIEVRPTGRKTYAVRYTDKYGRQHQYKVGSARILSLQQAKRLAKTLLAQVIQGSNPQQNRRHLREMPTLAEFVWSKYMPFVESYKTTPHTDEGVFRRYVLPMLGSRPLCEITPSDILNLMSSMKKRGLGPASIQRMLQVVRYAFNLALKHWRIPGLTINPADGIPEPSTPKRERYLSEEELVRLLEVLRADHDQRAANAALLILLTGARRMEVLAAKWDYVDLRARTLLVPKSKNGKPRHITLNDQAIELIKGLPRIDKNAYLFPHPRTGEPYHIAKAWERIRNKADLQDLRVHDLRHSFASFLINKNVSIYVLKELLGHASISTTQRYSHLTKSTRVEAVQVMGSIPALQYRRPEDETN